jgi:hypothetical protein
MNERVKVKEPPRKGSPRRARFHLKDGHELIGWTDDAKEAKDWLIGFGPATTVNVEDRRSWVAPDPVADLIT